MHSSSRWENNKKVQVSHPEYLILFALFALYVPAYNMANHSLAFLTYSIGNWSFFGHLSRFIYKNIYLIGLLPFLFLLTSIARTMLKTQKEKKASFSLSSTSPEMLVGFAILLIHELLFFKVPLEISYLLPLLFVAFPLWLQLVLPSKKALLILVGLTFMYSFIVNPDILDRKYNKTKTEAIGAKVGLFFRPGLVISDVAKREPTKKFYFKEYKLIDK